MRKPLITKIVNVGLICYLLAGIAAFATRPNLDRLYKDLYTTSTVKEYRGDASNYANKNAKQFDRLIRGTLDPGKAYDEGTLRVDGDLDKALKFSELIQSNTEG